VEDFICFSAAGRAMESNNMIGVLKMISWVSLGVVLLSPFAYVGGWIGMETLHFLLLAATLAWFAATPWWMLGKQR
jgi:hypothetical protein